MIIRGNNPVKVYRMMRLVSTKGYMVSSSEIEALMMACKHGNQNVKAFILAIQRIDMIQSKKDFNMLVSCFFAGTLDSYSKIEQVRKSFAVT